MSARDDVLARIRAASPAGLTASAAGTDGDTAPVDRDTAPVDRGTTPAIVPRRYRTTAHLAADAVAPRLIERLTDYGADALNVSADGLALALGRACARRDARRLAAPADLPPAWAAQLETDGVSLLRDSLDAPLSNAALDGVDGVITACALAIAETGTLVLDGGPGQGRRALSLLPDWHLCVVPRGRIVASVPEAVAALREAADAGRPITLISGPSATSDIELSRVEGVHGPRTLSVLILR